MWEPTKPKNTSVPKLYAESLTILAYRIRIFATKDVTDTGPPEDPPNMPIIIHNRRAVAPGERCSPLDRWGGDGSRRSRQIHTNIKQNAVYPSIKLLRRTVWRGVYRILPFLRIIPNRLLTNTKNAISQRYT